MIMMFCGPPGVGKSTTAERLAKKLKERGEDCRLFVSDEVSTPVYEKTARFLEENRGADFLIFDATFYRKKFRDKIKDLKGKHEVLIAYLHCDLKTCIRRNEGREPKVPEKAVHIIHREMEKPVKPDISINTGEVNPDKSVERVLRVLADNFD